MAYYGKVYVAFDGENDLAYYQQMLEWKQSDGTKFAFIDGFDLSKEIGKIDDEKVKEQIQNRIMSSQVFILLVTKTTKRYRKFIRWQVEAARNAEMPIIVVNVNGIRSVDYDRIPMVFKRKNLSLHITFQAPILEFALDNWPDSFLKHLENKEIHTYRYTQNVYENLNLDTSDYKKASLS